MRYIISITIAAVFSLALSARTIIITESGLPLQEQVWFSGANFPGESIKKNWDEGRRIHAASYTDKGWFFVMAKETGYTAQTYKIDPQWPSDWIKGNWDKDYYISELAYGDGKWLIVMSQSDNFTAQSYNRGTWSGISGWLKEKRDAGYFITSMAYNGAEWGIVMSRYTPIESQGYFFANTYDDLKDNIQEKVWDKNYNIQAIEYGNGSYIVTYGNYSTNNGRGQNYSIDNNDVKAYIQTRWDDSHDIAYIGGGSTNTTSNNHLASNTVTTNNGNTRHMRTDLPNGGYIDYTWDENGVLHTVTRQACLWCHGTKICSICNGAGGVYGRAYGGMWYPCKSCGGAGGCQNCKGEGFTVTTTVTNPDGTGSLISSNGYTANSFGGGTVVTSPNGNVTVHGGGSDNHSSSSKGSSGSGTCPKCNGKGFESTSYTHAAASAAGWMQSYHCTGGKCPHCNRTDDHYHYPCTECHGYGHIK